MMVRHRLLLIKPVTILVGPVILEPYAKNVIFMQIIGVNHTQVLVNLHVPHAD